MSGLLDDLRGAGRHHSFGTFSLDQRKAQEKMREFQLVDPHEYVLQLVAAAVAGQAGRVDIKIEGQRVELMAHDWKLSREILEQPMAGLFIAKDRHDLDTVRHFSIGLNALFGLRPTSVEVTSSAFRLSLDGRGNGRIQEERASLNGTRIVIQGRWTWRDALRVFGRPASEVALLQERAAWAGVPIVLNGKPLSHETWVASATDQAIRRGMTVSGAVDFRIGKAFLWLDTPQEASRWLFVRHGIVVAEHKQNLPPLQPSVAVYCDSLLTNASESDIVDDITLRTVIDTMPRAADDLLLRVCKRYEEEPAVRDALRPRLLMAASMMLRLNHPAAWDEPLQRALAELPLFRSIDARELSLRQLRIEVEQRGVIHYTQLTIPPPLPRKHAVIKMTGSDDEAAMVAVFGNRTAPFGHAADLVKRTVNMTRWRMGATRGAFEAYKCLVTVTLDEGGFRGEVGLPRDSDAKAEIVFLVGGRVLCRRLIECDGLSLLAVIEHPELSVNLTWDDVEEEEVFSRAVAAVIDGATRACRQMVETLGPDRRPPRATQIHLLRLLRRMGVRGQTVPPWLLDVPLFEMLAGDFVSIAALRALHRLHYVIDAGDGPQPNTKPVVLLRSSVPLVDLSLLKFLVPGRWTDYRNRLESDRTTLRLEMRPVERPAISDEALCPTPFKRRDVNGVVGLAPGTGRSSRVRLLRKGRFIEMRSMQLEMGPLEVTIDIPSLVVDATLSRVLESPALDRIGGAIRDASPALAKAVAAAFVQQPSPRLEAFLHDFIRVNAKQLSGEIEACPIFRALDGTRVSLLEIRESIRKFDNVRFVWEALHRITPPRLTLVLTPQAHQTLEIVFGSTRLQDWSEGQRAEALREAFMARPTVARALPPGDYVFTDTFELEGVQGVVALARPDDLSTVTVLYEERPLVELPVQSVVPLRAVVWSARVTANRSFSGTSADIETVIMRVLKGTVEQLIGKLSRQQVAPHSVEALTLARFALMSVDSVDMLTTRAPWSPVTAAARCPMFETSEGAPISLLEMVREGSVLRWVEPSVGGRPADGQAVVRLNDDEVELFRLRFRRMQVHTARLEASERMRAERRLTAAVETVGIPPAVACLARITVDDSGMRGEIGLRAGGHGAGITLVCDGMALDRFEVEGLPALVGMVSSERFHPTPAWDGIVLTEEQKGVLHRLVAALHASLGDTVPLDEVRRAALFAWFMACRVELKNGLMDDDEALSLPVFESSRGAVGMGALLQTFASKGVIAVSATPIAAPQDECVVVAAEGDAVHRFLAGFFGGWNVAMLDATIEVKTEPAGRAPVSETPVAWVTDGASPGGPETRASAAEPSADTMSSAGRTFAAESGADTTSSAGRAFAAEPGADTTSSAGRVSAAEPGADTMSSAGRASAAEPGADTSGGAGVSFARPAAVQAPPTPAAILLRGVAACFASMAVRQQYDWDVGVFQHVRQAADGRSRELARYDEVLVLNVTHPQLKPMLDNPTSPTSVAFCASILFTAYNQALENVTDAHEISFMQDLLLWHRLEEISQG